MKRYRITNHVRFTAFVSTLALLCIVVFNLIFPYNTATGMDFPEYTVVLVKSGDTLWDLAKAYGPGNADIREVICEIGRINDVSAYTLRPGMEISIPKSL